MAAVGTRGTVTAAFGFNPDADAQKLRAATKGAGTDEKAIIEVLARRSIAQRQLIKEAFKRMFGKDLADELRSELSGNLEKVVLGLLMPAPVYDAHELRDAIKVRPSHRHRPSFSLPLLLALTEECCAEFGRSLEDDICGDTSGMFQRVLVSLLTAGREESTAVDKAQAEKDAQEIFEAGEGRWGTDETAFLTVLCIRGRNHLLRVFQEYKRISGRDIEDSIKREMSGNLEDVFLAIVKCIRNKPAFFAEQLHKSMKGMGTTDSILIRIMVSRAEIDMTDIKEEFAKNYGKTLHSFIKGDTSGDYRAILLELCGRGE
ncbi:annexin A4-like [Arapaima gigas]